MEIIGLPLLAVAGGAAGFLLRRWELASAFEDTGLAILWTAPTLLLIALSVALAAAFALLCRRYRYSPKTHSEAFANPGNWASLGVFLVSAGCLLLAGLERGRAELGAESPRMLVLLLSLLCAISCVCICVTAVHNFRDGGRQYSLALLVPAYTSCLWLVTAYQNRASDPVVLDYVYEMLAIICTLLGLYFMAGFSFGKGKTWRCAFFSLLGIYFSLLTLADGHDLGGRMFFLFAALHQMNALPSLLRGALTPPADAEEPEPTDTDL